MASLQRTARSFLVEHDVPIEMRDGIRLRAEVYRPADSQRCPVLLVRTPYGELSNRMLPLLPALEAGFAVVVQYCRGTGTSDGDFTAFAHEPGDGTDTIAWCAAQPWSTGRVGMYGASYLGMVQFAAAVGKPPALRAMVPVVTPADYHWGLAYRQGAFQFGQAYGWHVMKAAQQLAYAAAAGEDVAAELPELTGVMGGLAGAYQRLPLGEAPVVHRVLPGWRDWLAHEAGDAYWRRLSYAGRRPAIEVPALHVGGWFDLFLGGTLDNYVTLSGQAATEPARRGQRLIVGPWTHMDRTGAAGELNFSPLASDLAIQLERIQLEFLAALLHGDSGEPPGPPVRIFVMGDNVWREENEWPLARTEWTDWYLHGDGTLTATPPDGASPASRYRHDPADPVPTVGGATLMSGSPDGGTSWLPGPRDQRAVEGRPDVLSFTSAELGADVEVTGPVTMTLYAATSAADTDFTAKLVDVWPGGRAMSVTDGIVRARFREGPDAARPIRPGECYEYRIDLIATSQVFKAGHRIRVEVASSNFPCYDRNPGNGAPAATATERDFVVAEQAVFHEPGHASRITLPVIPRASAR